MNFRSQMNEWISKWSFFLNFIYSARGEELHKKENAVW